MQKKFIGTLFLAAGLVLAQPPEHKAHQKTAAAMSPHQFATEAAIGNMAEVELGRMAASKATNADVKKFGQRMVDDHGKALDELKSVAGKENIQLPTEVDAKHKAVSDRLSKLSGAEFDKAYVKEMVKDHDTDVKLFERESQHGTNAAIKDYAGKTLPTLQEHQRMIKEIDSKMMGKPSV
jgi:putative membrane protein